MQYRVKVTSYSSKVQWRIMIYGKFGDSEDTR